MGALPGGVDKEKRPPKGGGRAAVSRGVTGGKQATLLMCLRVRHGPEGTAVFYEAPKGGAGAGGAKVLVPSLCDPCPMTRLSRLALPICEGSRQVAQVLPTPASPPPSFLGPRRPELTGPQWAQHTVFLSSQGILTHSQVQSGGLWGCFQLQCPDSSLLSFACASPPSLAGIPCPDSGSSAGR